MKHPIFLAYSVLVLGFSTFAAHRGWSPWVSPDSRGATVAPKTIRDNPGAYRSTYGGYTRYTGGK